MRKFRCDNCAEIVPEKDIFHVKRAGKIELEHICRECICFIGEPKYIGTELIELNEKLNEREIK